MMVISALQKGKQNFGRSWKMNNQTIFGRHLNVGTGETSVDGI
jgi:hypothetical protein